MKKKIRNALVSVSDKDNLKNILKTLKKYKINIISSGGTYKSIKKTSTYSKIWMIKKSFHGSCG